MAPPNGCRRRAFAIRCYSKENSLRKLLKKFRRDPKLWKFAAGTVVLAVGRPQGRRRHAVAIPCYSKERAYGNSSKTLSAIQLSDQKLWTFSAGILVAAVGRPERTSSTWSRDSRPLQGKQPTKTPRTFELDPTVDQKLWTFSAGTAVGSAVRPERTSSVWSRDSTILQGKQPTKTPLKFWARFIGRIKSYRPFEPVLWSRRWDAPTDVVGVH